MATKQVTVRCVAQSLLSSTFGAYEIAQLQPVDYERLIQHAQERDEEWNEESLGLCNFEVLDAETGQLLYKAPVEALRREHDTEEQV